jgi:hypothetical protein
MKAPIGWEDVRNRLRDSQNAQGIWIPRHQVPHPRDEGGRPTFTWPDGQSADYALDGDPPLAIREYAEGWQAFADTAALTATAGTVVTALRANPDAAIWAGGALMGAGLGAALSNKREGVVVGAGLGLLFAALLSGSTKGGTNA